MYTLIQHYVYLCLYRDLEYKFTQASLQRKNRSCQVFCQQFYINPKIISFFAELVYEIYHMELTVTALMLTTFVMENMTAVTSQMKEIIVVSAKQLITLCCATAIWLIQYKTTIKAIPTFRPSDMKVNDFGDKFCTADYRLSMATICL